MASAQTLDLPSCEATQEGTQGVKAAETLHTGHRVQEDRPVLSQPNQARPFSSPTLMCLGEWATSGPCSSGKLMMAELVHYYKYKKSGARNTYIRIHIYKFWIAM